MKALIPIFVLAFVSDTFADGPFAMQPANFHSVGGFLSLSNSGMNLYMGAGTSAITNAYTINGLAMTGTGIIISVGSGSNYGAISPLVVSGTNYALPIGMNLSVSAGSLVAGTSTFGSAAYTASSLYSPVLSFGSPFKISNGTAISITAGTAINYQGGNINVSLGGPIYSDSNGNLNVSYGSGLALSGGSLVTAGTYLSSISANAPITGNGTSGSPLTMAVATSAANGYLSSSDWTTFNGKQTSGNYITALSGNLVATGPGSVGATIQPGVVTLAMMANESANTILGNSTGSPATPTALTPSTVATMLGIQSAAYTTSGSYSPLAGSTSLTTLGTIVTGTMPLGNLATIGSATVLGNSGTASSTPSALSIATLSGTSMLNLGTAAHSASTSFAQYTFGANSFSGSGNFITTGSGRFSPLIAYSGTTNGYTITLGPYNGNFQASQIYSQDNNGEYQYIVQVGGAQYADGPSGSTGALLSFAASDASNQSYISAGNGGVGNATGPDLWYQSQSGVHYFADQNPSPGRIINNPGGDDGSTALQLIPNAPTSIVTRITAAASQTANLSQWENSSGSAGVVLAIGPNGVAANSTVYTNSASQLSAAVVQPPLLFSGGTWSLSSSATKTLLGLGTAAFTASSSYLTSISGTNGITVTSGSIAGLSSSGSIATTGTVSASAFNVSAGTTALTPNGLAGSGNAICSQPFQGATYKKVIIYFNAYNYGTLGTNAQVYTFPTAFTYTPLQITMAGISVTATVTTTSYTVTAAAAQTGFIILEGY